MRRDNFLGGAAVAGDGAVCVITGTSTTFASSLSGEAVRLSSTMFGGDDGTGARSLGGRLLPLGGAARSNVALVADAGGGGT